MLSLLTGEINTIRLAGCLGGAQLRDFGCFHLRITLTVEEQEVPCYSDKHRGGGESGLI